MDSEFLMELIFHLVANMQVGNLSKFHVTILMALQDIISQMLCIPSVNLTYPSFQLTQS